MSNDNFIFNLNQYNKLQQGYNKVLTPNNFSLSILNSLIKSLENNNFQLPLNLQNSILNTLLSAKEILNLLHKETSYKSSNLQNNPFNLIYNLSIISINLNSHTLKSAYQILYLKANNLILEAIKQISNHFSNKSFKIFKFI